MRLSEKLLQMAEIFIVVMLWVWHAHNNSPYIFAAAITSSVVFPLYDVMSAIDTKLRDKQKRQV